MSELSQHAKLIKAIEIAKGAQVGIELSYFDVLEVAGELNEAKEVVAMLNARIAELESLVEQLIWVSEKMFTAVIAAADPYDEGMREWDKIVNDWKEG